MISVAFLSANANASSGGTTTATVTETVTQTTSVTTSQTVAQTTVTKVVTTTIQVPTSTGSTSIPAAGACTSNQQGRCNLYVTASGSSGVDISTSDGYGYSCGSNGACSNPTGQVTIGSTVTASLSSKGATGSWSVNGVQLTGSAISFVAPHSDLHISVVSQPTALSLDLTSGGYALPLLFLWYDSIALVGGAIVVAAGVVLMRKGD